MIHLISIPVTTTSVYPARHTGSAIVVVDWALAQLWFFRIAPLLGALLAGLTYFFKTTKNDVVSKGWSIGHLILFCDFV